MGIHTVVNNYLPDTLNSDQVYFDLSKKTKDKKYRGLEYLLAIIKLVYSEDVWKSNSSAPQDILKQLNKIIADYNSYCCSDDSAEQETDSEITEMEDLLQREGGENRDFQEMKAGAGAGWIPKELLKVCDPKFKAPGIEKCDPYLLLGITPLSQKLGTLKVKKKTKRKCERLCNNDCLSDGECFVVPNLPGSGGSGQGHTLFNGLINPCKCIPCFLYTDNSDPLTEVCFQSVIVPQILHTLLDNFKKIYSTRNDKNPRTAYYIWSDNFENMVVDGDIRDICKELKEFIENCETNGNALEECENINKTNDAVDPSCKTEKRFCDEGESEALDCIKKPFTIGDILKDYINYYLNPTDTNVCYCLTINPITGDIDPDKKDLVTREECTIQNKTTDYLHVCDDDSYSLELLKHLKDLKSKCSEGSADSPDFICPDLGSSIGPFEYDADLFNINLEQQSNSGDEPYNNWQENLRKAKNTNIFRYINPFMGDNGTDTTDGESESGPYCYCKTHAPCNNPAKCGEGAGVQEPADADKNECRDVEDTYANQLQSEGGSQGNPSDSDLVRHNIIRRNKCESNNLRCMGYRCENGGADNSHGSYSVNTESNLSMARRFFHPLIPEYTGDSLQFSLKDASTMVGNTFSGETDEDLTYDLRTAPIMEALGLGDTSATHWINQNLCDRGQTINTYASIDERDFFARQQDSETALGSIQNALNPLSWGGCIKDSITSFSSATPRACNKVFTDGVSIFSNIGKYFDSSVQMGEDELIASGLNAVGDTLVSFCPTDASKIKAEQPFASINYSWLYKGLLFALVVFGMGAVIFVFGPPAIIACTIVSLIWGIIGFFEVKISNTMGTIMSFVGVIGVTCFIWLSKNGKLKLNDNLAAKLSEGRAAVEEQLKEHQTIVSLLIIGVVGGLVGFLRWSKSKNSDGGGNSPGEGAGGGEETNKK